MSTIKIQSEALKKLLEEKKDFYISLDTLRDSLRIDSSKRNVAILFIILAVLIWCPFFFCPSGYPQIAKTYAGITVSGYADGKGTVESKNPARGNECNITVTPEHDDSTGKPVQIEGVSCNIQIGEKVEYIHDERYPFERVLVGKHGYSFGHFIVVLLPVLVVLIGRYTIKKPRMIKNIKKALDEQAAKHTPIRLSLRSLSKIGRSAIREQVYSEAEEAKQIIRSKSLSREALYSTRCKLQTLNSFINICEENDKENSIYAFKAIFNGGTQVCYCYGIREDELKRIIDYTDSAGTTIQENSDDISQEKSQSSANVRTIYFVGPWNKQNSTPHEYMDLILSGNDLWDYRLIPANNQNS